MADRQVAITGLGTVNPLARNVEETWSGLLKGKSGISEITLFDASSFTSRIGGEVKNWAGPDEDIIDGKEAGRMDRYSQFAVQAGAEAVKNSGIDFGKEDAPRCAVVIGSGIGGLHTLEVQHKRLIEKGPKKISPFTIPRMMINAAGAHLAIMYGIEGANYSVVTACASAAHAMCESARLIWNDYADIVLTGGSEAALTTIGLGSFCSLKGLSTRNDDPQHASRPWDRDRDGFLLAEGAGCLVFEELQHAVKRGAVIYGIISGCGATCDAHHITAPDPEGKGAAAALTKSLKSAGLNKDDIGYINAHGTSTVLGDIGETEAIKKAFGEHAYNGLAVSSTKSCTGHMLGATGGLEMIVCALVIRDGILPATTNLDNPDEKCDLDYIPHDPREKKVDHIISNSFGFGGHNACLVLSRYTGQPCF